jgi:hypothetical protein
VLKEGEPRQVGAVCTRNEQVEDIDAEICAAAPLGDGEVQMRRDARHLHDIAHILTACEDGALRDAGRQRHVGVVAPDARWIVGLEHVTHGAYEDARALRWPCPSVDVSRVDSRNYPVENGMNGRSGLRTEVVAERDKPVGTCLSANPRTAELYFEAAGNGFEMSRSKAPTTRSLLRRRSPSLLE